MYAPLLNQIDALYSNTIRVFKTNSIFVSSYDLSAVFEGAFLHSYFFLGVDAITMAVDGLDVIHTAVVESGLFIEFAPFLILPTGTCAAARHQS